MKINKLLSYSLGFLLLAFSGVSIKYLNIIFTYNLRWLIASLLFLFTLFYCGLLNKINKKEFFLFFLFNTWIFLTIIWSQQSSVTLYKSIAYFIVCSSCLITSYHLSSRNNIIYSISFMLPVFLLSLIAGFGGLIDKSLVINNQRNLSYIYSGIASNTNTLGILSLVGVIIGSSLIIRSKKQNHKLLNTILTLTLIIICFSTYSRTSIISLLFSAPFIFLGITKSQNKSIYYIFFTVITSILIVITFNLQSVFIDRFILKTEFDQVDYESASIIKSRLQTLSKSYESAKKGGLFGLGFGVSDGVEFKGLTQKLSLVGYSREKTSGFLAIIEEVGIIGLLIYLLFILSIFLRMFKAFKLADKNEIRFLYIILSGVIALLCTSFAEAFILSPGSMELPLFYSFLGSAIGSSTKIINNKYLQLLNNSKKIK